MEIISILILVLLLLNLYISLKKTNTKNKVEDEYLIKGIVSELIENEESQIYKLLSKSDQTVKDFIEKNR